MLQAVKEMDLASDHAKFPVIIFANIRWVKKKNNNLKHLVSAKFRGQELQGNRNAVLGSNLY